MARATLAWYRRYYLLVNLPLLFLVADLAAARLDPVRFKANDLVSAYARLRANPPAASASIVLVVGNSGTLQAVDPDQLGQALSSPDRPVRAYNFGLSSARIDDVAELTRRLIAEGIVPRAVVLGLNPFLVDDRINSDSRFPWLHRRSLYLYFHRSILRELIKKVFRGGVGNPNELGGAVDDERPPTAAQRAFAVDAFLHEFDHREPDYPLLHDVRVYLAWLADQGIAAHVVVLPISPDGRARLASFPALIAQVRGAAPPGSLDLVERYPYTAFKDIGHVNAGGRRQVTAEIATWIAAKGGVK